MTLTPTVGRLEAVAGAEWQTRWIDDSDVTDTRTFTIEAYADDDTIGQVRFLDSAGTELVVEVTDWTGSLPVGSIDAVPGIIEVQGRVSSGDGLLYIQRAELVAGSQFAVTAADVTPHTIAAVGNVFVTEGSEFQFQQSAPAHNGTTLFLEQDDGAGGWILHPIEGIILSIADSGTWRFRSVLDTSTMISTFTVTVNAAAIPPTVVQSNPVDVTVVDGGSASWNASASGQNLTSEVFYNGVSVAAGTGAFATYTRGPVSLADNGGSVQFRFTGDDGVTAPTTTALLTVTEIPNGVLITDTEEVWNG